MGKVTIKDVAREAGVSISTVSNALNGVNVLHPDTKAHILEVADRMHYIPNMNGRNLKSKSTKIIGLFVTSMKGTYFGILADSIFWECKKYGYELNVFVTWNDTSVLNNILGKSVDGAIILNTDVEDRCIKRFSEAEIPVVFLDREAASESISSVIFDSYKDGQIAADHVLSLNPKRIACIQGIMVNYDGYQRFCGFRDRLQAAGVELADDYIWKGEFEREAGFRETKMFLEKGLPLPDTIFAENDLSAIGCIEALHEAGIQVPEQIRIMGFDDIELCEWFQPTLTTVKTFFEKQGVIAVEQLMKLINKEGEGSVTKLHGELVVRESTKM